MPAVPQRVLVVEDDSNVAEVVRLYLERDGFTVDAVADGLVALDHFAADAPDLVVLDLMLPGLDGLEVCRRMRATSAVPVIMLTARSDEEERIAGLETGADDYVAKPFSPRELTARVKAVLRRAAPVADDGPAVLEAGRIHVDRTAHEVRIDGAVTPLTAKEFELLAFLMRHPRTAFRREELLEAVWGWTYGDTSTVTVHIRRVREKVEADPANPRHVCTVWGLGYRFEP